MSLARFFAMMAGSSEAGRKLAEIHHAKARADRATMTAKLKACVQAGRTSPIADRSVVVAGVREGRA